MNNNWPTKKLGEVAEFLDNLRKPVTASDRISGPYPYYGANGQQDSVNDYIFDDELVLLAEDGGYFGSKTRPVAYRVSGKCWVNNHAHVLKNKDGISDIDFLGYSLMYYDVNPYISGTTRAKLNKSEAMKISLKVPSLSIQKQIVERMDEIAEARKLNDELIQKSDELFDSLLHKELNPAGKGWKNEKLGEIAETSSGGTPLKEKIEFYESGKIPWLRSGEVSQGLIYESELFITEKGLKNSSAKIFPIDTVLMAMYGATAGQVGLLKFKASTNQAICGILPNDRFISEYLYYFLKMQTKRLIQISTGGAQPNISQQIIRNIRVPLPDLKTQKQIVTKLSAVREYKKQLLEQKLKLKELFDSVLHRSISSRQVNR